MIPETWSIGQLAACAGLPVKTIRYYSDSGLLPVTERSSGGHRRYGPEALERLRLIRQLRALNTPVATITQVVTGERSLADLVTGELESVQEHLIGLRWRQATLQALDNCLPEERLRRLELLSRVQRLPEARAALADHWRVVLTTAMPGPWLDRFVALYSPDPPADPTAESALAYAELHLLTATPAFTCWTEDHAQELRDAPAFYQQAEDAAQLTAEAMAQGRPPGPGAAVDAFVAAHARVRRETDTPAFRTHLYRTAAHASGSDPRLRRYWSLVDTVTGGTTTNLARAHAWLTASLAISLPQHSSPDGVAGGQG